jgi:hypothetical protein
MVCGNRVSTSVDASLFRIDADVAFPRTHNAQYYNISSSHIYRPRFESSAEACMRLQLQGALSCVLTYLYDSLTERGNVTRCSPMQSTDDRHHPPSCTAVTYMRATSNGGSDKHGSLTAIRTATNDTMITTFPTVEAIAKGGARIAVQESLRTHINVVVETSPVYV